MAITKTNRAQNQWGTGHRQSTTGIKKEQTKMAS